MGDAAGQVSDGFHFLRLNQRLARFFKLLLGFLSLGDIPRDFRISEQRTVGIADGVDDDVGPESRPVLTDAPAFLFEASLARGRLEGALWLAGFPILVGIEHREMLADGLVREVALDPLRAQVPVAHAAVAVEHVDGVVGDALHQQPELFLAFLEDLLGGLALGQVPRDLGIADNVAGR